MSAEVEKEEEEVATYDFDEDFQRKLAALILRDTEFNQTVDGLVDPSYFTDHIDGIVVKVAQEYFNKYRFSPSRAVLATLIKDHVAKKLIRSDDVKDLLGRIKDCYADDLLDKEFIADNVALFARRKALEAAIFAAADFIDQGKFEKVEGVVKNALNVGLNEETNRYGIWENVESRAEWRQEFLAGRVTKTGVTTGFREIDDELYHNGWGRGELSVLMAPAKAGKSMSLIGFSIGAALAGYNVAYVTLEVAAKIIADRVDANIGNTKMSDLVASIGVVKGRVEAAAAKAGVFDVYDYPTGSLSPGDLRRLVAKKAAQGVKYDLVVVDYVDLMRPDVVSNEPRENSRLIYVGLRGIASEFDAAVLSATQTNREGFKANAGKMEHVAEDINKVRTVDLMISLNASEDERLNGEARMYFAASRNQRSDITIRVKTDIDKAKYIERVLGIE